MSIAFDDVVHRLEDRLHTKHPSLREATNPVLVGVRLGQFHPARLAHILGQYAFLPAKIVNLLQAGCQRAGHWPAVRAELRRNVAEELGSRTSGISHYELLKAGIHRELGLDLERVDPWPATDRFIHNLLSTIASKSPAYAAGMVYALEDSAIPELTIVAHLVNACATEAGSTRAVVHLDRLEEAIPGTHRAAGALSLHDFFVMHLVDFEIGHKTRLADALAESLEQERELEDLEAGYVHVLEEMDAWWQSLADWARTADRDQHAT